MKIIRTKAKTRENKYNGLLKRIASFDAQLERDEQSAQAAVEATTEQLGRIRRLRTALKSLTSSGE
jgi:hypothetical protein